MDDNVWLTTHQPRPESPIRLLCFPHAGSSAAVYGRWPELLPREIEVTAVEYPGRGSRRGERPFVRLSALVAAMVHTAGPALRDRPFAVFGHCLGALIGFEFARQLHRHGGPRPVCLFAAGCRAPSLPPLKAPVFALPDEALMDELTYAEWDAGRHPGRSAGHAAVSAVHSRGPRNGRHILLPPPAALALSYLRVRRHGGRRYARKRRPGLDARIE